MTPATQHTTPGGLHIQTSEGHRARRGRSGSGSARSTGWGSAKHSGVTLLELGIVIGVAGALILSSMAFSGMCWSSLENEQRIYNIVDIVRALQNAGQKYYYEKLCGRYYYGGFGEDLGDFLAREADGRLRPGQITMPAANLMEMYGVSLGAGAREELEESFGAVTWIYRADNTAQLRIAYDHTARRLEGDVPASGFTAADAAATIQARLEGGGLPTRVDGSPTQLVFVSPVVFNSAATPVSSSFLKELNEDGLPETCLL